MSMIRMDPISALGSGAVNGRYRTPTQTTHSSSSNGANPGDTGTQAQLAAAQQAALNFANSQPGTYTSTSGIGLRQLLGAMPAPAPAHAPPPVVEYAGIKGGEIIAYRCWVIKGNVLHSTYTDTPWNPNEPMTGDVGGDYGYAVGHGVHAFKDEQKAREYAQIYSWNPLAFGRVKLWGEVIEHERGYRAENARIISIDEIFPHHYTFGSKRHLQVIRKRYGVNEYANGNGASKRQEAAGEGEEERQDNWLGRDDIPSGASPSRGGKYWNYLRSFLQGRGV